MNVHTAVLFSKALNTFHVKVSLQTNTHVTHQLVAGYMRKMASAHGSMNRLLSMTVLDNRTRATAHVVDLDSCIVWPEADYGALGSLFSWYERHAFCFVVVHCLVKTSLLES